MNGLESDTETFTDSFNDSRSTASSQGSNTDQRYFQEADASSVNDASWLEVYAVAKVDDRLVVSSPLVMNAPEGQVPGCMVASLMLNREVYLRCWEATPLSAFAMDFAWILSLARYVSHEHALLTFFDSSHSLSRYNSIDVVDQVGKCSLNGVPLHPFHRYHCHLDGACGFSEGGKKGVELWVSKHVAFRIVVAERAASMPHRALKSTTTTTKIKESVTASPVAKAKKASSSVVKAIAKKPVRKPSRVLYSCGVRLTRTQATKCRTAGLLLNPDFAHASSAETLVLGSEVNRSVKLLCVIPHVSTVVTQDWLTDGLRRSPPDFSLSTEPYAIHLQKKKGQSQLEQENGFTLHDLLRFSKAEREQLFRSFVFWVHPKATPQDPPLNDLKSVIEHSGGTITTVMREANVLVLPSGSAGGLSDIQSELSLGEQRGFADRCSAVKPDELFKCVLQHDVTAFTRHSLPADLFL